MAEVKPLSDDLSHQREERRHLQLQIDELVSQDTSELTALEQRMGTARVSVDEARKSLRSAADGNQIYRLAAMWYRVDIPNVTPEQFATARWVFSTFSSIAVALAGTIAALVYYARSRVPGAPSFLNRSMAKVARAHRAYDARKRKPLKVEVPGPERVVYRDGKEPAAVVEKEVTRFIDQIVLTPRWGLRLPSTSMDFSPGVATPAAANIQRAIQRMSPTDCTQQEDELNMEQRLDHTYLCPGLTECSIAVGICAAGIGMGIFLAAWGISFLWRYAPPQIAVRIANPEVHIAQGAPLKVTQDKPFDVTQSEPFKIDTPKFIGRGDELPDSVDTSIRTDPKTGEVIKRQVTVFLYVRYGPGTVTTGWTYRDGAGGAPVSQYCYYEASNIDNSRTRVDVAANRLPLPNTGPVPDLGEALAKCQWWQE